MYSLLEQKIRGKWCLSFHGFDTKHTTTKEVQPHELAFPSLEKSMMWDWICLTWPVVLFYWCYLVWLYVVMYSLPSGDNLMANILFFSFVKTKWARTSLTRLSTVCGVCRVPVSTTTQDLATLHKLSSFLHLKSKH